MVYRLGAREAHKLRRYLHGRHHLPLLRAQPRRLQRLSVRALSLSLPPSPSPSPSLSLSLSLSLPLSLALSVSLSLSSRLSLSLALSLNWTRGFSERTRRGGAV